MVFTMLSLRPEVLDRFALPRMPLPVRVEKMPGILLRETVSTEQLLEELLLWLPENPGERERYRPVLARLSFLAGAAAGQEGRHADAIKFLRTSLEAMPDSIEALLYLGNLLRHTGEPQQALDAFERVRQLLNGRAISPELWQDLAELYAQFGNYRQALELIEQAVELAPERVPNGPKLADEIRRKMAAAG